jgi:hypothetical protein
MSYELYIGKYILLMDKNESYWRQLYTSNIKFKKRKI